MPITNIENFYWGLSLVDPSNLEDNQFEVLSNMQYNKDKRIQTRRGITTFGNAIGSDPITSYFFWKNDTTGATQALCTAGTQMYEYDESTWDWNSIKTWLTQYEADGTTLTRWSFAVYLNVVYMCNWVDAYASYDWTTYTEIGTSSVWTCTFTNATNLVNLTSHWMADGTQVKFTTTGTLPAELTAGRYYYVINSNTNDFQIALTPGWSAVTFTDDGTGTHTCTKLTQPTCRYIRYMADSIYWAWEDLNPSTIYATTAGAVNANTLDANDIKVGWDEFGRINWMLDLWNVLLVFKDKKIYNVAWDLSTSQAIDAANGWFCNRAIQNVENAIMYYNDAWVDRVKPRSWVAWATAMATEPLANDLRSLLDDISPDQRNTWAWYYSTSLNNYYFTFDTWDDSVPDKTLIYSSLVWAWSQYNLLAHYDYWLYVDTDWTEHHLIASANGWQMYEIETWFQDNWSAIEWELKTKRWDFGNVWQWKTFDAIDITGLKNEWSEITVQVIIDWEVVQSATIDDNMIDITTVSTTIWTSVIGANRIGWWAGDGWWDIDLYQYLIRIPMYNSWPNVQVRMICDTNPNVWSLDSIKISREDDVMDLFPIANIW